MRIVIFIQLASVPALQKDLLAITWQTSGHGGGRGAEWELTSSANDQIWIHELVFYCYSMLVFLLFLNVFKLATGVMELVTTMEEY